MTDGNPICRDWLLGTSVRWLWEPIVLVPRAVTLSRGAGCLWHRHYIYIYIKF